MEHDRAQTNANPGPDDRTSDPEDVAATHSTDEEDDRGQPDRQSTADEASADSFPGSDAPAW